MLQGTNQGHTALRAPYKHRGAVGAEFPVLSWIHQLGWEVMGWKTSAGAWCQTLGWATAGRAARGGGRAWQWGQPLPSLAKLPDPTALSLLSPSPTSTWVRVRHCQLLLQLQNFIPPLSDLPPLLFLPFVKFSLFFSFMLIQRGGLVVPGRGGSCVNFPAQSHNQLCGWFRQNQLPACPACTLSTSQLPCIYIYMYIFVY